MLVTTSLLYVLLNATWSIAFLAMYVLKIYRSYSFHFLFITM